MALTSILLKSHPLSEPHSVKEFNGQKIFYTQNWKINYSPSRDIYQSPFYSDVDNNFNISFSLNFDENNVGVIGASLLEQSGFKSFYVFFKIENAKGENIFIYDQNPWNFDIRYNSNNIKINKLKRSDITTENGLLDNGNNINISIEISFYLNKLATANKKDQQAHKASLKIPGKIGLKNMNSTCYLNSFLQVLFHIPEFRHILFSVDTSKNNQKQVLRNTQYLFYMMKNSTEVCSAQELVDVIPFCSSSSGMQQDAHEFAIKYLDDLQNDLKGTSQENSINELFDGKIKTIFKCKNVDYETSSDQIFKFIDLPIEKDTKNLLDCINKYTCKSELEINTEKYGMQEAESSTELENLPPILQICLQRTGYDKITCRTLKKEIPLSFNSDFDLVQFTGNEKDEYILYAVLSHKGESDCGHFCVFIRDFSDTSDFENSKWFKYSDSVVNEVSSKTAIDGNFGSNASTNPLMAYMLYYVRKSDQKRLFHIPANEEMAPEVKAYMEHLKEEKERQIMENNYINFRIILEKDLNAKSSIDVDDKSMILKDTILRIHNTELTIELYTRVAKLFNKNPKEIRLWSIDKKTENSNFNIIMPSKENKLENLVDLLLVQNKSVTESFGPYARIKGQIPNKNLQIIFLKYFDTRMKLPIRYIGTIIVDKNNGLEVPQINKKLGFPEWTKFYFFKEISPTTVKYISPDKTFNSSQMFQGSVLIVQINPEATREKLKELKDQISSEKVDNILPDLTHLEAFQGVEIVSPEENEIDHHISPSTATQSPPSIPHFNAIELLPNLRTNLLDFYLSVRFHMMRIEVYDYEEKSAPKFTVDFPVHFSYKDMCNVVRKANGHEEDEGLVLLFSQGNSRNKVTFIRLDELQFENKLNSNTLQGNKLYYLFDSKKKNKKENGKLFVYTMQIAPDGYNVTFTKIIMKRKMVTPIRLLQKVATFVNFPSEKVDVNDIENLRFLDVHESRIFQSLLPNENLQTDLYPIRVCKLIHPLDNEVPVRVHQAVVDSQLGLDFVNEPFYINLRNQMTVSEFKKLVLSKVKIQDVELFMKANVEKMTIDNHRSSGVYWSKPTDQIVGLTKDCVIYVVYNHRK